MKRTKTVLAVLLLGTLSLAIAGCAQYANQVVGSAIPGPLGQLIIGFVQGWLVLVMIVYNLITYLIPLWGHTDLYQDQMGLAYDVGFFLGVGVIGALGYFGNRRMNVYRSRRRNV